MRVIWTLSKTFLLELLREKILVVGLLAAIGLSLLGLVLGSLSFDERARISFHLSVSAIHLISLALGIFFGSSTLHREVDRQTCLLVLSRPVTRVQFYLSKFFAIGALIFIFQALLSVVVAVLTGSSFEPLSYLTIFFGFFLEILILLAFALFFSVLMRATVAIFAAIGIFLVGHWIPDLQYFAEKSQHEGFQMVATAIKWVFPHLYQLNFRSFYYLGSPPSFELWSWAYVHGLAWIIFYLVLGAMIWRRKDLV